MRKLFLIIFITFCISLQLLITYYKWEVYPFNPSTMYSHKFEYKHYNDLGFEFLDDEGEEHKLEEWHVSPMDPQRLFNALNGIYAKNSKKPEVMNHFAKSTFELYKVNSLNIDVNKKYVGFRIYKYFWNNKESLLSKVPSKKILLGEYVEE